MLPHLRVLLVVVLALAGTAGAAVPTQRGLAVTERRGDLDLDGSIAALDALAILSGVVGKALPSGYRFFPHGDVNCDGNVSALDALVVLSHVVERDVSAFCIGDEVMLGDGTYGNYEDLPDASGHARDYLLGSPIVVPQAGVLTHFGIVARRSGSQVKVALYGDVEGNPGPLVAALGPVPVVAGRMELSMSPVALDAGTYWFMAVFDVDASVGIRYGVGSDVVKYIGFSFASPLPDPFPPPTTYTAQGFNYYLRVDHGVSEAGAAGPASRLYAPAASDGASLPQAEAGSRTPPAPVAGGSAGGR